MLTPPTFAEPAAPPPPIDQRVRDLALQKFRALVRGNGVKPEAVEISSVAAQILKYQAQGYVRLATQYTSQTLPGKIDKGEVIGDPHAFENALKTMTTGAQRDAGQRQAIVDAVMKRPDKGYGAREQSLRFDTLSRDFVSHETCGQCNQTGKSVCARCGGQKVMTCQTCHGRHSILCPNCRGTGQLFKSGQTFPCTRCRSRKRIQCPACAGNGQVKCKGCNGGGTTPCAKCKASGFLSHIAHAELTGHLHFDYDRQGLPRELTKLLDAFALRYIEKKDIHLAIHTQDYDEKEPPENIPIGYEVTVPYGEITFSFPKKQTATLTLMGHNGEFSKGEEFLDHLTRRGQKDLASASGGEGNVGESLRSAARFRLIRETIIAAASHAPHRVSLSKLLAKYPVGISSEKLLRFMLQAESAIRIITRKPRITGLSAGLLLFVLVASGYFILLRDSMPALIADIPFEKSYVLYACDAMVAIFGVFSGVAGARIVAGRVLRETLKGLASPAAIEKLRPKIGWTLWISLAVSAIITGIFHVLAK